MSLTLKCLAMAAFASTICLSVFAAIRISSTYTAMIAVLPLSLDTYIETRISFCLCKIHLLQMVINGTIPTVCMEIAVIHICSFLISIQGVLYLANCSVNPLSCWMKTSSHNSQFQNTEFHVSMNSKGYHWTN